MPGDSRNLWCLTEGEGDEPCSRAYAYGQKHAWPGTFTDLHETLITLW